MIGFFDRRSDRAWASESSLTLYPVYREPCGALLSYSLLSYSVLSYSLRRYSLYSLTTWRRGALASRNSSISIKSRRELDAGWDLAADEAGSSSTDAILAA